MPPRRSGRSSLPTPAYSTKSQDSVSVSSTPAATAKPVEYGLHTPVSMTDTDESAGADLDDDSVQGDPAGLKRKVTEEASDSPFSSISPHQRGGKQQKQYTLEVTLPSKRSKLSSIKTASADNLTLGSPASKKLTRSSSDLMMTDELDEEEEEEEVEEAVELENKKGPKSRARISGVGNIVPPVSKQKTTKKTTTSKSTKVASGNGTRKSGKKAIISPENSEDELHLKSEPVDETTTATASGAYTPYNDNDNDGLSDFAMNSDQEEKQMKRAILASVAKTQIKSEHGSSSAGPSTGISSPATSSRAGASKGKKGGNLVRTAAARAAEKRKAAKALPYNDDYSSGSESVFDPEGSLTPLSGEDEDPTPSESELDSLLEEEDEYAKGKRGSAKKSSSKKAAFAKSKAKAKVSPKTKSNGSSKSKASPKVKVEKGAFKGRGRRLAGTDNDDSDFTMSGDETKKVKVKEEKNIQLEDDDSDDSSMDDEDIDTIDLDAMNEDEKFLTLERIKQKERRRRARQEAKLAPIRREERLLKQELGRKLTNGERNFIRLKAHHGELVDVWGDLERKVKPVKPVTMEAHPSLKLTLLPFQKESLHWMKKQEEGIWKGGMLADEMGMGKTIQTIALLLSEPRKKPSLVVAPVVALMQWKHEIETHAEGFTVCLWHGQGRMKADELKKYDVVMVSYGTLEAAFRRQKRGFKRGDVFIKEKSPMHAIKWHRIVLDEAHNIKERSTNAAKAAFALNADYRWCLSGTPLQNRVGELYSLVRFLGADPFSHYFCKKCDCKSLHWEFSDRRTCDKCHHSPMHHVSFWNTEILTPIAKYGIEAGNPGHTAFKKLKILLDRMMLRRTKLERADDLGLPPRVIVVRRDYFSPEEKELYMSLFTGARRTFSTYVDSGTVLNNYSNIFSLITRMRQMACHPDLVLRGKNSKLIENGSEGGVCRLCNDTAEDAIVSNCKHLFDRECIKQYLEVQQLRGHRPECPVCHIEISIDLEAEAVDLAEDTKKARQGILSRLNLNDWRSSTKLEALVEELEKLRNQDCTIKSLVFSQFVSFLDLIAFRLQRAGFNICRLEGGMTPQQRDATIQHFMKNTQVTVFLISLKAGGVALNLTEASMVFMMDSWWNPSVEYQAMDRIHRLGQKRPVKVVKLVVEDSIEDQIVQLQHKKLAMTEAALSTDPDAALGKLTVEDLGFLFKM